MDNLERIFKQAAEARAEATGEELWKIMDTAFALHLAGVPSERVYAFCKTGEYFSSKASQKWHDAVKEFNQERGH